MRIAYKILAIAVLAAFASLKLEAGVYDDINLNARPTGMGGAFCAIRGDADSVTYNPAGLSELHTAQLLFSYRDFYNLGLVSQRYLSFSIPERYFNFAFSWHRVGTTENVEFLSHREDVYTLTVAGRLYVIPNLSGGTSLKFYRVFAERQASGYGIDWGLQYYIWDKRLRFGLFYENLGTTVINWDTGAHDNLPSETVLGVAYLPWQNITLSLDYSTIERTKFGAEFHLFDNMLTARTGINAFAGNKAVVSGGCSVLLKTFILDYAVTNHSELGLTHFFTVKANVKRKK